MFSKCARSSILNQVITGNLTSMKKNNKDKKDKKKKKNKNHKKHKKHKNLKQAAFT